MAFVRDIAISTLVTLLFYVLVIECQTPAQQPLTAARPALVRSGKQKPSQIKVEKETFSFNVGDLATVVKETLTSNNSEIKKAIEKVKDLIITDHKNIERGADLNTPDTDETSESESSESDSSSVEDGRRILAEALGPFNYGHVERFWNQTHSVKDPPRTFRYRVCDRRYLRNICQYNIIKVFHSVCYKYNCTNTVIPRVWALAEFKCDETLKKYNPHKDNDIGIADHGDDNDDEIMKQVEEAEKNYEEYLEAKINKTKNKINKPTRRKKQPIRRNVPYFTAHFRHCIFIKDYCQEACFGAVKNVCRRFKCSRNASQELVLACKNCNISYIRNFSRQRLIYTDFMKRNQKVKFVNRGNFSKNYEVPIVEEKDRKRKRPKIGRHHPGDDNDSKDSGETKKKHKHKGLASDEEWYVFPPDDLLKTLKKTSNVSKTPKPGSKAKKNLSKNESANQDPDSDISYFYKSEEQEGADGQYFVDDTI